jgi:hypothetical protein
VAHAYRPFQELRSAPTPAQLAIAAARHMMQTVSASLSPAALLYLVTLVCVAFVAPAVAVADGAGWSLPAAAVFSASVAAVVAAALTPLRFSPKTKLYLDGAAVLAAIVLLDPATAMLAVGLGATIAQSVRRQPWDQAIFNGSLSALLAGLGAGFVALTLDGFGQSIAVFALAALIASGLMLVANVLLLAPMIAFQMEERVAPVCRGLLKDAIWGERRLHAAQAVLAVAVALAIAAQPWSIVALPVLILVIRAAPITSRGAEPMPAA